MDRDDALALVDAIPSEPLPGKPDFCWHWIGEPGKRYACGLPASDPIHQSEPVPSEPLNVRDGEGAGVG